MGSQIYKKMSDVMKDIKAVTKDQTNSAQGFKFRGIDQFVNALYPALTKHGVFMAPEVVSHEQEVREVTRSNGKAGVDKHVKIAMKYTFYAEDGSNVSCSIPGEGVDSGDKATNKALSAALKYCLIQTFSIPTADMAEADFDSPELGTSVKLKALENIADTPKTDLEKLQAVSQEPPKKVSSFRKPTKAAAPASEPVVTENGDWS